MTANDETPRVPQALVVHESMFGNTRRVAAAIARGLEAEGCRATSVEVASAPATVPDDVDLLVVGAPTHAFSLSRASTRADAVRQGAPAGSAVTGVREWLTALAVPRPTRLAVFDTRVSKVRWIPKAAGPAAARLARGRSLTLVDRPHAFLVEDVSGPLVVGELDAAERWGRQLAVHVSGLAATTRTA